jgi:predicted ATP-grasp superfamily ATP-dependent carboligase
LFNFGAILLDRGATVKKPTTGATAAAVVRHRLNQFAKRELGMSATGRERVLVIGDDMRIFLAVVRSLGRAGKEVHAAPFNWHAPALGSKYVSVTHRIPRYSDDPAAWRDAVLALLKAHKFELVVPCCDRAIIPLHVHRRDFHGVRIAIPDEVSMTLMFDKERTRALCTELWIPVAAGARLDPSDTAEGLAARYGLPLVLKPRQSFAIDRLDAAGKVWIVDDAAELRDLLCNIDDTSRYLVESCFPGVGVGVSVLAQEGEILHAFQHRRLREGRGGSSSYRISETVDGRLLEACNKISRHTKLTGVCMFEFRFNPATRDWILLETNARFWGSMALPLSLGVDFPRYLYDLLVHNKRHEPAPYEAGIRSRNLVLDGFNLVAGLRHMQRRDVGPWVADLGNYLAQPFRWAIGKERSDSFVADDPWPGVLECATLLKSIGQRIVRTRRTMPERRQAGRTASDTGQPLRA